MEHNTLKDIKAYVLIGMCSDACPAGSFLGAALRGISDAFHPTTDGAARARMLRAAADYLLREAEGIEAKG